MSKTNAVFGLGLAIRQQQLVQFPCTLVFPNYYMCLLRQQTSIGNIVCTFQLLLQFLQCIQTKVQCQSPANGASPHTCFVPRPDPHDPISIPWFTSLPSATLLPRSHQPSRTRSKAPSPPQTLFVSSSELAPPWNPTALLTDSSLVCPPPLSDTTRL